MDLLVGNAREQGTTVVVVTHEARVAAYADREVVVRDGRVSPLSARCRRDPLRAAPHAARRPRGGGPPGGDGGRRRARRGAAAGHAGVGPRGRRPERPQRLAELRHPRGDRTRTPSPRPTRCWGTLATDHYAGRSLIRVDLAATGPESPVPPGLPRLPRPGEYYASPAMLALLRSAPPEELADRYPGRPIGAIGDAALPVPRLADRRRRAIRRRSCRRRRTPSQVTTIATRSPGDCPQCRMGTNTNGIDLRARRDRGGAALPRPGVHRHGGPAVRRPPRAAVRRDAAGRRDAPPGHRGRRRGGHRGGRRRHRRSASPCSPPSGPR